MEYRRADVKVSGVGIGRPDLSGNTDKLMLLWLLRTASSQQLLMKGYFHPIWLTNDIDWFLPVDFESATNRWCCDGRNGGMIDLVKWVSLAAENRRLLDSKLLKRWQESWAQSQPSIRLFGALAFWRKLKTKKHCARSVKIQLSNCNMLAHKVPQGNVMSWNKYLIGSSREIVHPSKGPRVKGVNYIAEA